MSTVKLGLDGLAVPDKIQYGYSVGQALDGNLNFPNLGPLVTRLRAATDKLSASYTDAQTARQIAKSKTSIQDDDATAFDALMAEIARDVQTDSGGDKAKIESAGFSVRAERTPPSPLPAPTDLQAVASEFAGSADLSWQLDRDARLFLIERAEDAEVLAFRQIATATKKSASVNSMVSGKKYWFRTAAVGPAGQGPWSDPVPLFAP
jgi:hypothetical protein